MQLPFTTVKEIWDLEARYLERQSATDESLEEAVIGFKENVRSRETQETPNGYLLKAELSSMAHWRYHWLSSHINQNPPRLIEKLTGEVFRLDDDWKKVEKLTWLHGVREPVASVILHLYDPKKYPILDRHALRAIEIDYQTVDYDEPFWQEYVNLCRAAAESYDVSMRKLDRALYQYGKDNS